MHEEGTGWPSSSTDKNIQQILPVVLANRQIIFEEVASALNISHDYAKNHPRLFIPQGYQESLLYVEHKLISVKLKCYLTSFGALKDAFCEILYLPQT
ncbi:hypothetical protein CEXT_215461 [Caerostris extrusa]|uniref:Uncharacterized protein n=1 Tax=Caerostris extrusa TaxID=172846 RepID=A0AAV4PFX4_CAEEX|nr:hypothetical protein CEXT_215461 [Caerostris extrusa]